MITEEHQVGPFDRITMTPGVMGGKPCIRGTRVTVGGIILQIGVGESIEELLSDFPFLERADILQVMEYAEFIEGREVNFAD
jgi:uncharacterized protein (DUF433 family)